MFLNALKMIIVPLIVSSIIVGIAGIERDQSFARMGGKTLLYYITTSTLGDYHWIDFGDVDSARLDRRRAG